jgi:hypothetical protein
MIKPNASTQRGAGSSFMLILGKLMDGRNGEGSLFSIAETAKADKPKMLCSDQGTSLG